MNNEFRIKNMIADDILYQVEQQTKEDLKIYYANISQENKQLKSILTELEEWLKGRIEWNKSILKEDTGKSDLLGFNFHREAYIKIWEDTLDKIQELKEKYK